MGKKHKLVEVEGYLVHETGEHPSEGAFLIKTEMQAKAWLPKLKTEKHPHPSGNPDYFIFELPEDLALEKGLI